VSLFWFFLNDLIYVILLQGHASSGEQPEVLRLCAPPPGKNVSGNKQPTAPEQQSLLKQGPEAYCTMDEILQKSSAPIHPYSQQHISDQLPPRFVENLCQGKISESSCDSGFSYDGSVNPSASSVEEDYLQPTPSPCVPPAPPCQPVPSPYVSHDTMITSSQI
jgi:hypothetical protein